MKPEDVATVVKSYSEIHFNKQLNQVHIHVFDDRKPTPKDTNQFMKMSDDAIDKHRVAEYSVNKNSGYVSYMCMKKRSVGIKDCKELLK
jgi:hypothetical protein